MGTDLPSGHLSKWEQALVGTDEPSGDWRIRLRSPPNGMTPLESNLRPIFLRAQQRPQRTCVAPLHELLLPRAAPTACTHA